MSSFSDPQTKFLLFVLTFLTGVPAHAVETTFSRTRFEPNGGYRTATRNEIRKNAGGEFSALDAKHIRVARACEVNLMSAAQAFSFDRMLEIGYLTPEEHDFYTKLSSSLEPEQVTFFHQYRIFTKDEMANLPPEEAIEMRKHFESRGRTLLAVEQHKMDDPMAAFQFMRNLAEAVKGVKVEVKDAALYVVRAQVFDRYLKRRLLPLPWMKEEEFKHAADISRMDVPLMWELGRAATIGPGNIGDLSALAVAEMANEARIFKVDPEKAKVFVHSRDREHTVLYRRAYGFTPFTDSTKNPTDSIMSASLAELMRRFPDTKRMLVTSELERLSGGILTAEKAAAVHTRFKSELFQALDFREDRALQSKPIILFNDLYEMGGFVGEELYKNGIPMSPDGRPSPVMNALIKSLVTNMQLSHIDLPANMVADPLLKTPLRLAKTKALRIYNIDPDAVKKNPAMVLPILLSVKNFYVEKIYQTIQALSGRINFPEPMYAIATASTDVRDAARALGGRIEELEMLEEQHVDQVAAKEGERTNVDLEMMSGKSYLIHFTHTQLEALAARNPAENGSRIFQLGKWNESLRLWSGPFF